MFKTIESRLTISVLTNRYKRIGIGVTTFEGTSGSGLGGPSGQA